jgi:hypothetical protein
MRLINTITYLIEKFDDPSNAPRSGYAILSHTWILKPDKELELEDIRTAGTDVAKANLVRLNPKIRETCKLAQAQTPAISHAWIDTICIDQNSSSDKSEAINAMYRYYQDAKICFTHFFDVDGRGIILTDPNPNQPDTDDMKAVRKEFTHARWFKRGWTLQELLAPPRLLFYDKNWNLLGSRNDLCNTIAGITHIEPGVLRDAQQMRACSIAKRMSWAAGRQTRRPEDKAYSLLGIFGVNMPMIYGEGDRAFIRLQEEIIKISDDHSLFAWSMSEDRNNSALLARSPDPFAGCTNITRELLRTGNYPYSVNNRGISMQLSLIPWSTNVYIAPINCLQQPKQQQSGRQQNKSLQLGLFLKREKEDDKYIRVAFNGKDIYEFPPGESLNPRQLSRHITNYRADTSTENRRTVSLHVKRDPGPPNVSSPGAVLQTINGFKIGPALLKGCETPAWESTPHSQWDATRQIVSFTPGYVPSLDLNFQESLLGGGGYLSHPAMVYFDDGYNLICELYTGASTYYDAYKKKEVKVRTEFKSPVASDVFHPHGAYVHLEVDRLDSLDGYFPTYRSESTQGYLHVMFRRESVSMGNSEVWILDVEAVNNFEGNPWA